MGKVGLILFVCLLGVGMIAGCAQKPQAENSKGAIQQAQGLETVDAKVKYLVGEANAFLSSEKFDDAINIAKYILAELDKDSTEAKTILERAEAELKAFAEKKAEEAKKALADKLGNL